MANVTSSKGAQLVSSSLQGLARFSDATRLGGVGLNNDRGAAAVVADSVEALSVQGTAVVAAAARCRCSLPTAADTHRLLVVAPDDV